MIHCNIDSITRILINQSVPTITTISINPITVRAHVFRAIILSAADHEITVEQMKRYVFKLRSAKCLFIEALPTRTRVRLLPDSAITPEINDGRVRRCDGYCMGISM